MTRFADQPIKRKLLLVITGTSVLALALACAGFVAYEINAYSARAARDMDLTAGMLAAGGAPALAFLDVKDAAETLSILQADPHAIAARFYASDGRLFAAYLREGERDLRSPRPAGDGRHVSWGGQTTVRGVFLAGRRIGTVVLTRDLGEMRRGLAAVVCISLVLLLGSSLAALAIAARLQRVISQPIIELTGTAKAIAGQGNYSARAAAHGSDELGALVASFNEMLEQIERRDAQLEQRVTERTAELTALNKELESFCYSVSHDLRAPLRAINGFSRLLLDNQSDRLDSEGKDFLARTAAAAQRMAEIIDDLLDLSRVTRSAMQAVPVDLCALARDVASELQSREPGRRVAVAIDEAARVLGDANLLRLLLENLLSNAWKFTSRTTAPRVEFRARREGGRMVFSVRDNGAGFDPAYADKLFKPFSRLHSETEFAGTGVGLATVARIVERHGGRIWAEGAVGRGAVFHFILPEA